MMNKQERVKQLKNRLRKGLVICQDSQLEVLEIIEAYEKVVEEAKNCLVCAVVTPEECLHELITNTFEILEGLDDE